MRTLVLMLLAGGACAPLDPSPLTAEELETYPDARGMPADVQQFMVQWNDCQHWLGEFGWDSERQRQIDRAVRDVCPGVDARAARLRARYAGNAEVLVRLARFERLGQ